MYRNRIISRTPKSNFVDNSITTPVTQCLGSRIRDQMYNGVDSSVSTLLHGQFDDDNSWHVDPACDMSTDRFVLDLKERVPVSAPHEPTESKVDGA